jgi:hypothetical protein
MSAGRFPPASPGSRQRAGFAPSLKLTAQNDDRKLSSEVNEKHSTQEKQEKNNGRILREWMRVMGMAQG